MAPVILLAACTHHAPVATVEIIDTSLSITPRAKNAVLSAVGDQITSLGRGDILVVIPITNDARDDVGGRILRLQAPSTRESYDADLKRFRADAQKRFIAWASSLDPHQRRTDLLGALDAARQEFASIPADDEHRLIVAGDFLEDDDVHEFVRDRALTSQARARVLAADLRAERGFVLPRATLCLGRLESRDFLPLPEERKAAVQAFWVEYLSDKGKAPELHIDGTGLLSGTGGCSGNAQRASTNSKQNGGEP
jgi:hypothetical protein